MAIKTFSAGAVLTASDTNTYLANSGLVYVASKTWTATTSVQQLLNCFSSTYDTYRIVFQGVSDQTSPVYWYYQMITGTTVDGSANYYANPIYSVTGGAASVNWNTAVTVGYAGWVSNANTLISFDMASPNQATQTTSHGQSTSYGSTQAINGSVVGYVNTTNQYTGVQFGIGGGATHAGTVIIYGYRKA